MRVRVALLFGPLSSKQKMSLKKGILGVRVPDLRPFGSPIRALSTFLGLLSLPYIDIHDLQLTIKDVLSSNDLHTNIIFIPTYLMRL